MNARTAIKKRLIVLGLVAIVFGGVCIALNKWHVGLGFIALGGFDIVYALQRRDEETPSELVLASANQIGRGDLRDAERLLGKAERLTEKPAIRSATSVLRALIAMRQGDIGGALTCVDTVIEKMVGATPRAVTEARGLRALLRAAGGDDEAARSDVAHVLNLPEASAEARARAALAKAILLDRAGDRTGLKEHIERERAVLFGATSLRERAIVRALRRKLERTPASAYRAGLSGRDGAISDEEPPLIDWIAKLAPDAAPFAAASKPADGASDEASASFEDAPRPTEAGISAVLTARAAAIVSAGRGRVIRGIALFAVLCVVSVAAGLLAWSHTTLSLMLVGATLATAIPFGLFRAAGVVVQRRRLIEALEMIRRGNIDAGAAKLMPLSESRSDDFVAAEAHLALSQVAEHRADPELSLAHANIAMIHYARLPVGAGNPPSFPLELLAQRAFALAFLDRFDEARAEVESLRRRGEYVAYVELRVELLHAVRGKDLPRAALLLERAGLDLPLGIHDELLADAVRALQAGSDGHGRAARIRDELAASPEDARWLEMAAPWLCRQIEIVAEGPGHLVDRDRDHGDVGDLDHLHRSGLVTPAGK